VINYFLRLGEILVVLFVIGAIALAVAFAAYAIRDAWEDRHEP
jgi:hypothetical protein